MFRRVVAVAPRIARGITATRPIVAAPRQRIIAPAVPARKYHEKDKSSLALDLDRLTGTFLLTFSALLDHYSNPRNVGSMAKADEDVGTGLVGAPACGDVMKLQIRVDKDSNTISDVKFKTFGCGSAIASSSYLTELVRGMTLDQAGKIQNTEIAKELCLPPVKCKASPILFEHQWYMSYC